MLLYPGTPVAIGQYEIINFMVRGFPVVLHLKYVNNRTERAMQPVSCFSPALSGHIYN